MKNKINVLYICSFFILSCSSSKYNASEWLDRERVIDIKIEKYQPNSSYYSVKTHKTLDIERRLQFLDFLMVGQKQKNKKITPKYLIYLEFKSGAILELEANDSAILSREHEILLESSIDLDVIYDSAIEYDSVQQPKLATGFYYISKSKNSYKRLSNIQIEEVYIDPMPIITLQDVIKIDTVLQESYTKEPPQPIIVLTLNKKAARNWEHATATMKNGYIAEIINDQYISSIREMSKIPSGKAMINMARLSTYEQKLLYATVIKEWKYLNQK
jgi:hypothetical protein